MVNVTPRLLDELAQKTGLPRAVVTKAVLSQFQYAASIMGDDTFRSVRIRFLGSFQTMDRKLRKMQLAQVRGELPPDRVRNRPETYPYLDSDKSPSP